VPSGVLNLEAPLLNHYQACLERGARPRRAGARAAFAPETPIRARIPTSVRSWFLPSGGLPLKLTGTGIYSMGLAINGNGQAITRSGAEVPGLYATGNAAAYTEQPGYVSGLANTRAITTPTRLPGTQQAWSRSSF
jgi:hypothetical protein